MRNNRVSGMNSLQYQEHILPGVSRTFALTIPQLPPRIQVVVANAYLLCRIADTIEDDVDLSAEQKTHFHQQFIEVVAGKAPAQTFAQNLTPQLSEQTIPAEKDLVSNTALVIEVTHSFNRQQQDILQRCITVMCQGMPQFVRDATMRGLGTIEDLNRYCYYVAGVVGEMLTALFCDYSSKIAHKGETLKWLAISFGQGLQMTNILKDVWDDRKRGVCWLPRDAFSKNGEASFSHSDDITQTLSNQEFADGMRELLAVAHAHLRNALSYTLLIPREEVGIRRFCLRALGMAILTLRNINRNLNFSAKEQVKISRRTVKATVLFTNLFAKCDRTLIRLFDMAAKSVPFNSLPVSWEPETLTQFANCQSSQS